MTQCRLKKWLDNTKHEGKGSSNIRPWEVVVTASRSTRVVYASCRETLYANHTYDKRLSSRVKSLISHSHFVQHSHTHTTAHITSAISILRSSNWSGNRGNSQDLFTDTTILSSANTAYLIGRRQMIVLCRPFPGA